MTFLCPECGCRYESPIKVKAVWHRCPKRKPDRKLLRLERP